MSESPELSFQGLMVETLQSADAAVIIGSCRSRSSYLGSWLWATGMNYDGGSLLMMHQARWIIIDVHS